MGELAYSFEEESAYIYSNVAPMLPQGESLAAYCERVGTERSGDYPYALALYREQLAQARGLTLEQLHEGQMAVPEGPETV